MIGLAESLINLSVLNMFYNNYKKHFVSEKTMSHSISLGGPIEEIDSSQTSTVNVSGLNATPMKAPVKKTTTSMATGADSDDDPAGRIPSAPSKSTSAAQNEVMIKSGQFETSTHEMSTSYEPPVQESSGGIDDAATDRMLRKLEQEMTKGRQGGVPSNELDNLMYQISNTSDKIVKGRKELMN